MQQKPGFSVATEQILPTQGRCRFLRRVKESDNKERKKYRVRALFQKQISRTFPGPRLIFQGLLNSH